MSAETIRQRLAAATRGVWEAKHPPGDSWVGSPFRGPIDAYRNTGSMGGVAVIGVRMDPDDATFIAAARQDIPLLLVVAEAAEEMLQEVVCHATSGGTEGKWCIEHDVPMRDDMQCEKAYRWLLALAALEAAA